LSVAAFVPGGGVVNVPHESVVLPPPTRVMVTMMPWPATNWMLKSYADPFRNEWFPRFDEMKLPAGPLVSVPRSSEKSKPAFEIRYLKPPTVASGV
jgi:hypothetical protein